MTVLSAHGAVLEREYAFGVVLQLLEPVAANQSRRSAMFAGAAGAARTVFEPGGVVASAPGATFAVVHGLFWTIANMSAEGPLLVCVDDLQWADEVSLRFLDFLARRADDLPLALLLAVRSGEAAAVGAGGALGELMSGPLARAIEPAALSEAAVLAVTRARFGARASQAFARACWSSTGGNPLYLAELQRELLDENVEPTTESARRVASAAPRAVGRVILARLARLGERAATLARALSIIGDHALLPDAAKLAGLSREHAAEAAQALFAAGIVGAGRELRFTHPLLRSVVYADMPEVVRGERHARAARILDERGRPPDGVVVQLLSATPAADGWVSERLRAAARRATAQGAPAGAIAPLERALSEPPADDVRPAVLLELGEAEAASGHPGALEHLDMARELSAPGASRASAALALSRMLTLAGQRNRACEIALSARGELDASDRELSLLLAAAALGAAVNSPGVEDVSPGVIGELAMLRGATPGECAVLANVALRKLSAAEPKASIAGIVERAIEGGGCAFSAAPDGFSPLILVSVLTSLDAVERAAQLGANLVHEAQVAGSPLWFAAACAFRAPALLFLGAIREAESEARMALETAGSPFPLADRLAAAALARALVARGKLAAAERELDSFSPDDETVRQPGGAMLQYARAQLEGARGRYEQQFARLTAAGEIFEAAGAVNPAVTLWRPDAAIALVQIGRREHAHAVLAPALDAARRFGGAFGLGTCLRAAALIEEPASVELLRGAVEILQTSEIRVELARNQIDLGAALRRLGHRREARGPLREGMELAHQCGAVPLVERARTELLAAGARPRRVIRSGLDALTPAELRVAQLAANGMSNVQIAQSLFVTRKTIETQIGSVLRKLDLSSRAQLSKILREAPEDQ